MFDFFCLQFIGILEQELNMSLESPKNIEDVLHIVNPEHYKHLGEVPITCHRDVHIHYNIFQYALEQYIKDMNLSIEEVTKSCFKSSTDIRGNCEVLINKLIEISSWSVRTVNRINNCVDKVKLVQMALLDLYETPPETFDLKKFNSDAEYRENFAQEFQKISGYSLPERFRGE